MGFAEKIAGPLKLFFSVDIEFIGKQQYLQNLLKNAYFRSIENPNKTSEDNGIRGKILFVLTSNDCIWS